MRQFTRVDKDSIEQAMNSALLSQAVAVANMVYLSPGDQRGYACEVATSQRPAVAKRLCNGHYIRKRTGRPVNVPLRTRLPSMRQCWKCADGTPISGSGGWGLCGKHYKQARRMIVKMACVDALGGQCSQCNGKFPSSAFDFHHLSDDKEDTIGNMFSNASTAEIAAELSKCVIICANCHRIVHAT